MKVRVLDMSVFKSIKGITFWLENYELREEETRGIMHQINSRARLCTGKRIALGNGASV